MEKLETNEYAEFCLDDYIIFDCPGQVEIFTHHSSLRNMFFKLQKLGYRVRAHQLLSPSQVIIEPVSLTFPQLVVIHLIDSYTLTLPSMYISALLLSLRAMLQMDLPHLNVLTKIDNLHKYPPLPFNLDFYTEVQDLSYIIPHLKEEAPFLANSKFDALNKAIVEVVQDFGLVAFETLAVEDKKSMMNLLQVIDRASGYVFGTAEGANDNIWQVAVREGMGQIDIRDVQERWIDAKEEWDDKETNELEEEAKARNQSMQDAQPQGGDEDDDFDMDAAAFTNSGVKTVRK